MEMNILPSIYIYIYNTAKRSDFFCSHTRFQDKTKDPSRYPTDSCGTPWLFAVYRGDYTTHLYTRFITAIDPGSLSTKQIFHGSCQARFLITACTDLIQLGIDRYVVALNFSWWQVSHPPFSSFTRKAVQRTPESFFFQFQISSRFTSNFFFQRKNILESTSKKMIARVTLLYNAILF